MVRMSVSTSKIHYSSPPSDFYKECQKRIHAFLEAQGSHSGLANSKMWLKVFALLTVFIGSYALMLSNQVHGLALFLTQVTFQFTMFVITIGIIHDGAHQALFRSAKLNRLVCYGFDLFGINSHHWLKNHLDSHHKAPNVPGYDSAVESFQLVRLHPGAEWKPWHPYQHYYMFVVYSLVTLFQVFILEWASFAQNLVGFGKEKGLYKRLLIIAFSKSFVLFYSLILPLMVVQAPKWLLVAGFIVGHMLSGIALGVIFQTTHLAEKNDFVALNDEHRLPESFDMHILKTTINFSPSNSVVTFIAGGLNLHVTHHLFPHISQIYLIEMTRIVRETAREFNVPYREYSLWGAVRSHLLTLRQLGRSKDYESWKSLVAREA